MSRLVVKIQRALFPPGAPGLIYNKARTFNAEMDLPAKVIELMAGRPKLYAEVEIHGGALSVVRVLPDQPW